jgi:predicted amidophosphoribosyltransferase
LNPPNHCPVCRARFREARLCSRCGADLTPLMLLATQAWQLREAARLSLNAGEFEQAHGLAIAAQNLQFTSSGESLRLLGGWLTLPEGN